MQQSKIFQICQQHHQIPAGEHQEVRPPQERGQGGPPHRLWRQGGEAGREWGRLGGQLGG